MESFHLSKIAIRNKHPLNHWGVNKCDYFLTCWSMWLLSRTHGPIHLQGNFHIHHLTSGYILCHFQGWQFKEKKYGRSLVKPIPYVFIYKITYRPRQRLGSTCMYKGKEQTCSAGFIILHLFETTKNIPCQIFFNNILKKQKE
jgi:hypothetical protein